MLEVIPLKVGYINFTNALIPIIFDDDMYYNKIPETHKSGALGPSIDGPSVDASIDFFKETQLKYNFFNIPIISKSASVFNRRILDLFRAKKISSWGNIELILDNYESTISTVSDIKGNAITVSREPNNIYNFDKFPAIATYAGTDALDFDVIVWFTVLPEKCWSKFNTLDLSDLSEIVYVQHRLSDTVEVFQNHAIIKTTFHTKSIDIYGISELNGMRINYPDNFYANPSGYNANKGETVTPNFVLSYDDGNIVEPYTNVIYDDSEYFNDNIASLSDDGISIILSPNNKFTKRIEFKVRPNIPDTELWTIFHIMVNDVDNPYYDEDSSGIGGGNGSYGQGENYFDTLGKIPNGSSEANDSRGTMYTRYLVNLSEMSTLGDWLWADDLGLQVAKTAISLLYGDPVQTVISCVSYPFNLSNVASSSSVPFHWGGHDAGFNLSALNQNAFSIDWGTITISEYWGNFLDYSPHTQMQLYLPWGTGFVHIDPNDILKSNSSSSLTGRGTLGIKTNVDLSRGICVHNVIANNTVIGSYSGSCGRQIPITGSDYASKQVAVAGAAIGAMFAGALSATPAALEYDARKMSGGTSMISGGGGAKSYNKKLRREIASKAADRFGRAMRPAIACAAAVAVSPPSVSRSGSFQEGAGSLSIQQPYLIISRPKMSMPRNYGHLYGYPSNITAYLGSLTGYTEVGAIHIEGITATSQEIDEIESLLMGGVIL